MISLYIVELIYIFMSIKSTCCVFLSHMDGKGHAARTGCCCFGQVRERHSYRFCSRCRPASSGWGGASGRQRDRIWRTETTTEEQDTVACWFKTMFTVHRGFIYYVICVAGLLSKRLRVLGQPLTKQLLFVSYATTTTNDDTTLYE